MSRYRRRDRNHVVGVGQGEVEVNLHELEELDVEVGGAGRGVQEEDVAHFVRVPPEEPDVVDQKGVGRNAVGAGPLAELVLDQVFLVFVDVLVVRAAARRSEFYHVRGLPARLFDFEYLEVLDRILPPGIHFVKY